MVSLTLFPPTRPAFAESVRVTVVTFVVASVEALCPEISPTLPTTVRYSPTLGSGSPTVLAIATLV